MGRALRLEYVKYGVRGGAWVVPGIAPPGTTRPHHPGYTPPHPDSQYRYRRHRRTGQYRGVNMAVGLRSVDQLTLRREISDIRGMTEVYNL